MRRARARLLAAAAVIATAGFASAALDLVVTNPALDDPAYLLADGGFGSDVPDVGMGIDASIPTDGSGTDADADADAGGPALEVNPTMLDFQSLPVGDTASQMITLRNAGTVPLTNIVITLGANAAHWSISNCTAQSPCTLPSFGSQTFVTVTFQPMAHDERSTMAHITSSQTPAQYVDLRGIGLGGVMAMVAPPLTDGYHLDLGTIPRGQTTSAPITVRNNGNAPITVSVTGAAPPYTVMPASPTPVAPGTTQDFTVTCGSDTASPSNDRILDVTSDAYAGGDERVTVHCAIANTLVQVDPLAFDFGELRTNGGPETRMMTVTVTNPPTSAAPARLYSMRLRETIPGLTLAPENTDTTLAVGQTATAVLALTNSADTDLAGQFLDIHVDNELLALPVTGKVVTASSRVAPEQLDLGTACTGTQVSGNVMLINTGTATLEVDTPQIDASFVVSSPDTPARLPPTMSFTATVSPATNATGAIASVLAWHDDVPTDHAVPVKLEYIESGTALSPRGLDFGSVEVDVPVPPRRIELQNCDMTPTDIEIESLRTRRGALVAWYIDPRVGYGKQLAGREEQSISVSFEPPARGRYEADLTIVTAEGKQVIRLVGDATGRDFDRTSFYACACRAPGPPLHGWPIATAIAIVVLRRRRRRGSS